jgi:hypothetical protein
MKTLKLILITLAAGLFFIFGCEKEITNPFDPNCPKELFTPTDFKTEQEGTTVRLSWKQTNTQITGSVISRNENDGAMIEVTRIDKTVNSWNDPNVKGGIKYGYRLAAYAGDNQSNTVTAFFTPVYGPTVSTDAVSGITSTTVVLGGNVTDEGGASVTERGVCYGTTLNPTTADKKAEMGKGPGSFSLTISGLTSGNTYYARAYAINSQGTTYGTQVTFTTSFLTISPNSFNVAKESGSKEFTVASNTDWQVNSNQTWCTLSATGGKGNGSITAIFTENKEVPQRTATITFTGAGIASQTATITQAGTEPPVLTITPDNQNVTNPAGTTTFNITSNVSWTATSDQTWCTITNTSGDGNGTLTVNYEANTTNSQRIANLAITGLGLSTKTVTIAQKGFISKTWDYIKDYSLERNPNGEWSVGRKWSPESTNFDLFTTRLGDSFWYMGNYGHGGPSVAGGGWIWAKNNSNGLPCVRWTSPESGEYSLNSSFTGIDNRGMDALVFIYINDSLIFNDKIQAYNVTIQYNNEKLYLKKSDNIDFVIKWNGGVYSEYSVTSVSAIIKN